jgi:hypothetical protein
LLYRFQSIIESYQGTEFHGKLLFAHCDAIYLYRNLVLELYLKDRGSFATQIAESNPFILGLGFYWYRRSESLICYFSSLRDKVDGFKDFASVSFGYINDFIWGELKSPISDPNTWKDRLELIKAHIGYLKKVQRLCHPVDEVFLKYDSTNGGYSLKSSMRFLLKKYDLLIEEFKFDGAKIDLFAFEQVLWKIVSLSRNSEGKFILEKIGPLIDLCRLYSIHFMNTPIDEYFLFTIHPKLLSLCAISYCEKNNDVLFGYFRLPTRAIIERAVKLIPHMNQWQIKIYSRLKYLEKVYQNNSK